MYWQIKGLVLFPITAFADVRTFYYDFFAGFISCQFPLCNFFVWLDLHLCVFCPTQCFTVSGRMERYFIPQPESYFQGVFFTIFFMRLLPTFPTHSQPSPSKLVFYSSRLLGVIVWGSSVIFLVSFLVHFLLFTLGIFIQHASIYTLLRSYCLQYLG